MRVTTLGAYQRGLTAMQQLQTALDRTQRQISSGKRILTPSDDPIASSRAIDLREKLARLEQFDRNSNLAQIRLQDEEASLSSVNNLLQRVRELALQANNSTQSNESRQLIATEMRQRLEQLVDIANSKDGSGRFIFSGNLDSTTPISRTASGFSYNGDQGQREIQIGESRRIFDGDSGDDVFFRIRAGNGVFLTSAAAGNTGSGVLGESSVTDTSQYDNANYSVTFLDPANYEVRDSANTLVASGAFEPGGSIQFRGIEFMLDGQPAAGDSFDVSPSPYQNVFESVQQMIAAVETTVFDDSSLATMANGINGGLQNLDQAIGNVLDVQTRIGSRLAAIESQVDSNGAFALTVQDALGSIEDLDYAAALSRLSLEATTLEAAQKSFVATQRLSLFDYL